MFLNSREKDLENSRSGPKNIWQGKKKDIESVNFAFPKHTELRSE